MNIKGASRVIRLLWVTRWMNKTTDCASCGELKFCQCVNREAKTYVCLSCKKKYWSHVPDPIQGIK